jgi:SAM-dependent MidA family methyltransferase
MPISLNNLPQPDPVALQISEKLSQHIRTEIAQSGPIDFARYMEMTLYTPGLGYYSAGAQKFGEAGDFITAPEISPLFGQCIAKQIADVLDHLEGGDILEFGAGSGRLAVDILTALSKSNSLPNHYYILEVSASLKARQQALIAQQLPEFAERVVWLDKLPENFSGVILANEVLDAMPVHKFRQGDSGILERFVSCQDKFAETFDQASDEVIQAVDELGIQLAAGYTSEINMLLPAWMNSLASCLKQGVVLLIDYGFVRREYYHPDRHMGTLTCHYRHHSHDDVFLYPGLQDITAHVDFTAVAQAALAANLQVSGFATQAHFLMSCGLMTMTDDLSKDVQASYQTAQEIKKLVLPSEMGELFKVMALSKNFDHPLIGFSLHDMREKL